MTLGSDDSSRHRKEQMIKDVQETGKDVQASPRVPSLRAEGTPSAEAGSINNSS